MFHFKPLFASLAVAAVAITAVASANLPALNAQDAAADPDASEQYRLQRYEGDGYSLLLPPNAVVQTAEPDTVRIIGPEINVRAVDSDFTVSGPAYQLTITTEANADGLSSEAWATQAILAAWQEAQEQDEFTPPLPVTEAGELDPDAVESVTLAGLPAFRVDFFGGDATLVNLYVASDDQVLVINYAETIVENDPVAFVAQDVYALLLATLQFDTPANG